MGIVDDIRVVLSLREKAAEVRSRIAKEAKYADDLDSACDALCEEIDGGSKAPGAAAQQAIVWLDQGSVSLGLTPSASKGRGPDKEPRKRRSVSQDAGPPAERVAKESGDILAALSDGPMTITALQLHLPGDLVWDTAKVEAALANDPDRFCYWTGRREGDSADVVLWGTHDQLYAYAVHRSSVEWLSRATVPQVIDLWHCSGKPAAMAIDRAKREAAA